MEPLVIAVNTRMLLKDRLDGIGWFAYETLKRITAAHPEVQFIFLFDRPYHFDFIFGDNVTGRVILPPIRHGLLYYLWYQIGVKRALKKIKPDIFLSPDGLLSIGASCKQVAVIHDINFHHYPKDLKFWTSRYFTRYYPKSVACATRIATVSECTKHDIVQTYKANPTIIDVVPNGIRDGFIPGTLEEKKNIRDKYTGGQEYFLFVGSLHPRKNIVRLLLAFEQLKKEKKSPIKLVLAGAMFWGQNEIVQTLHGLMCQNDVIITGRVNDDDLKSLMGGAFALTYVPYFEGFGVPVIEAFAADVPVLTASATSLPEIAGEAALFVDPFDVGAIANGMQRLMSEAELWQKLITAGRVRRALYSWDNTAEKLWGVIEKCLAAP